MNKNDNRISNIGLSRKVDELIQELYKVQLNKEQYKVLEKLWEARDLADSLNR